jgi:hypothetical protein
MKTERNAAGELIAVEFSGPTPAPADEKDAHWSGLRLLLDATRQGARREALIWAWDEIGDGDPRVPQGDVDRDCFVAEGLEALAALDSQSQRD